MTRFKSFTESEKCSILDALKDHKEKYKFIEKPNEKGGLIEMIDNLIKEVDKSLEEE